MTKFGYSAETNTDIENQTSMGTGFVWKAILAVSEILNVVECRSQLLKFGSYSFSISMPLVGLKISKL